MAQILPIQTEKGHMLTAGYSREWSPPKKQPAKPTHRQIEKQLAALADTPKSAPFPHRD